MANFGEEFIDLPPCPEPIQRPHQILGSDIRGMGDTQRTLDSFLQWFEAQPGAFYNPAIQLVNLTSQGRGRGIIATQDLPAETSLFVIPRQAVLNVDNSDVARKIPQIFGSSRKHKADDAESKSEEDVDLDDFPDPWLELIIVLVYEYLHRSTSKWRFYLDVLPEELDTLMYWNSTELRELQSSAILEKIGKEDAENIFHEKLLPIIEEHSDVFYPAGVERLSSLEMVHLAHRMGGIIMAYAFDLEKEEDDEREIEDGWVQDFSELMSLGLVPMADMLNADAEFNAHLNHEEDSLKMISLRPIKAGEEILNYYGPLPNSELLRRYGYTSAKHSLYDVVEVPWPLIRRAIFDHFEAPLTQFDDADVDESFVLGRETDGPDETGVNNTSASFTEFPEELEEQMIPILAPTLNIEIRDGEELNGSEQHLLGQTFIQVMRKALDARIKQYPTTIAADQALLSNPNVSDRSRQAIVVRLGEKLLLQEAIDFADNAIANGPPDEGRDSSAEPIPKKRRTEA